MEEEARLKEESEASVAKARQQSVGWMFMLWILIPIYFYHNS